MNAVVFIMKIQNTDNVVSPWPMPGRCPRRGTDRTARRDSMKNFSRSAPLFVGAALGCLAWLAASVAVAEDEDRRTLSFSDMVKLSDQTEDQLEAAKETTLKYQDINVALAEGLV